MQRGWFRLAIGVLCATLTVGIGGGARARASGDAGREHVRKAKRAVDSGRFADAAKEYDLAYAASHNPALLVLLGDAHRLAGNRADALTAYEAYLRELPLPTTARRAEVERLIAELQPASPPPPEPLVIAPPRPVEETPPSLPPAALVVSRPPSRPLYKKWWFWTAVAASATVTVTAIAVGATQGQPREPSFLVQAP